MRVIAGTARGRRLVCAAGRVTRPTPDMVKGALFNILGQNFSGERVLDLFSGTGALSIEALSRGASSSVMVETDPGALRAIRRNLKATGFEDRVRIYDLDVERALQAIAADQRGVRFDLVLAGPPYAYRNEAGLMSEIARLGLMAGDAEAVFQHSAKRSLPDEAGGLYKCDSRRFGDTALSFYSLNPAARRH